jgi:hypothetical protein
MGRDTKMAPAGCAKNAPVTITACAGTHRHRFLATADAITHRGIRLLVKRALRPGEHLNVELPAENGLPADTVVVCIVGVTPSQRGEWILDCAFSRDLSDQQLEKAGIKRHRGHAHPCPPRNARPLFCDLKVAYQQLHDSQIFSGEIVDIALGGIDLLVPQFVEAGSVLSLELVPACGFPRHTMLACVVHRTTQEPGRFLLGCTFIRELREEEWRALVKARRVLD